MKLPDKIFITRWVRKHGKWEFKLKTDEKLFQALSEKMREGRVVDVMIDLSSDDGSLMQIAKLKAGTRELAKETGHTFIEIEQTIKKNAGLYNEITEVYESFGNCSSEKLSNAIQVMIGLGETVGLNLN